MISGIHIFQVPISCPEGTPSAQTIGEGLTSYSYTYDANGNMLSDQLNRTGSIKYDHRNLMTEIRVIKSEAPGIFEPPVDVLYLTQYRYDEAGNRVRKIRYKYTGSSPDPEFDLSGDAPPWTLQSDEFYVRDVSGKEIALYSGSSLTQWNIWGLDNVGKINADTTRNYYLKDHLGSIRVVLNSTNTVISAQDYDAWGYLLENRTYNNSAMKYDFTGKEKDDETSYDYFGARYYDSRIGRWGQVEPLLDIYIGVTPYNYSLNNPIRNVDVNGYGPLDLIAHGTKQNRQKYFSQLQEATPNLNLQMDNSGSITVESLNTKTLSTAEMWVVGAILNQEVTTDIFLTNENSFKSQEGKEFPMTSGVYDGSYVGDDGKIHAQQFINLEYVEVYARLAEEKPSKSILHETVEAYYGGYNYPNTTYEQSYKQSHNFTVSILPDKYTVATGAVGNSMYMQRTDDPSKIEKLYDFDNE